MDEKELIENIIKGEHKLYSLIVSKYKDMIFRVCMGFVHNSADAADLTQEVFIKAFENIEYFGNRSALSTWLYRIAVNASLNLKRKKKRERLFSFFGSKVADNDEVIVDVPHFDTPAKVLISNEEARIISNAIDSLSEKQHTAFVLSRYDDLPQREVAGIMEISEGAVEQLLIRARDNLKKKLATYYQKNDDSP